jgi:hypothetical protein
LRCSIHRWRPTSVTAGRALTEQGRSRRPSIDPRTRRYTV